MMLLALSLINTSTLLAIDNLTNGSYYAHNFIRLAGGFIFITFNCFLLMVVNK
jgi:hypothetical protein